MALFTMGDLHLSFAVNKPMDKFGGWENYVERISENWEKTVSPEDTVVIPGDISWAMNFREALPDFDFIHKLKGTKIISKGNHDYWWNTYAKMNRFLEENGFDSIKILHNNHFAYDKYGICGTRGWINDNSEPADAKRAGWKRPSARLRRQGWSLSCSCTTRPYTARSTITTYWT